jgi:hypothetical protein
MGEKVGTGFSREALRPQREIEGDAMTIDRIPRR